MPNKKIFVFNFINSKVNIIYVVAISLADASKKLNKVLILV